jgi:cell pole-organizing protein PopZ
MSDDDAKRPDNDPSMDDILASIRKIISEDEARAQVTSQNPGQATNQNETPSPAMAPPMEVGPGDAALDQDRPDQPISRGMRAGLGGGRDDVLLLTDIIEEPSLGPAGPRPTAPIPLPRIDPVRASEMPQPSFEPAPQTPPAATLVASVTAGVTSSAFDRLSQAVKQSVPEPVADDPGPGLGGGGKTIEEVVKEMLRPMLKEWLDKNLPPMVERMVEREIVRLTRR